MSKILVFDKGGRKERINLIKKKKLQKIFFKVLIFEVKNLILSIFLLQLNINSFLINIGKFIEEFFSKISNVGLRPLQVFYFREKINSTNYVVSLTDGFKV